ncbi:MAG: phage baseplate protein [Chloroflexi bacterium]|nr:MAG: phage baseplate protein [Chloroflexota bacterium]PIE79680.1 MAG: phage baseplate protein [Chloroflexota bacterium]
MTQNKIIGTGWAFPPGVNKQGGMALANGRSEIEQAIQIILMTTPGTRLMRPTFGSRLTELVFAPNNNQTAVLAQRYVAEALGMWEPRINVLDVTAYPDPDRNQCLVIEIQYQIKATQDKRTLVFPFYLIPGE